MGSNRKKALVMALCLLAAGCGSNSIKSDSTVTETAVVENVKKDDKAVLLEKAKDYSLQKNERVDAINKLRETNYVEIKKLLEELQEDGVLRDEILNLSFNYAGFNYSSENLLRATQICVDKGNYEKFLTLYNVEKTDIIYKEVYDKTEEQFLAIGKEISDLEDKVYAIDEENDQLTKDIKEMEKQFEKSDIEVKKKNLESLKADYKAAEDKIAAIKKNIEDNPENTENQKKLKEANENSRNISDKIADMEKAINKNLANPDFATIDASKRKIKDNNKTKAEIKGVMKEKRAAKDELGKVLTAYDENIIMPQAVFDKIINEIKIEKSTVGKLLKIAGKKRGNEGKLAVLRRCDSLTADMFEGFSKEETTSFLTGDSKQFNKLAASITQKDYEQLKDVINYYLNNGSEEEKKLSVELILKFENEFSQNLTSENFVLQKESIYKYGIAESVDYFQQKKDLKDMKVYRGLAIAGERSIFEDLQREFEATKDERYLAIAFLLKQSDIREYIKSELVKLPPAVKKKFFEEISEMDRAAAVDFVIEVITFEKEGKERISYLEYIEKNNKSRFVAAVLKIIESGNISEEESKYIVSKLKDIGGEDTSLQILKSLEKTTYKKRLEAEKERVSFSAKIDFWTEYLNEFPDSLYKEEISRKISIYQSKIESIRNSIKNETNIQVEEIDRKIAEYKEYIKDETNMGKITSFQNKIKELSKKKTDIIKNSKKSTVDTIKELERSYKNMGEEIASQGQYLVSKSSSNLSKMEREAEEQDLQKLIGKRAEILEKIAYLYSYYIEENAAIADKNILDKETLRDIRGEK